MKKNTLHKMFSPQGRLHTRVPSRLLEEYLSNGWTMYEDKVMVKEQEVSEEETQLTLDINEEND